MIDLAAAQLRTLVEQVTAALATIDGWHWVEIVVLSLLWVLPSIPSRGP